MTNSIPYWFKILRHFERKVYYRNGLTVPFLIGAREIVEPNSPILSITQFVEQVCSNPQAISVIRCGMIKELVFGIVDFETNQLRKTNNNLYHEINGLVNPDYSLQEISSMPSLITSLEVEYRHRIQNSQYSKVSGNWGYFTKEDQQRLEEVK